MSDFQDLDKLQPHSNKIDRVNMFLGFLPRMPRQNTWGHQANSGTRCVVLETNDKSAANPTDGSERAPPLLRAVLEITLTDDMVNPSGNLHGGFQVTLFDNMSTFAYVGLDRFWADWDDKSMKASREGPRFIQRPVATFGVSRTLNATYFRAIRPEDGKVRLEIEMVSETRGFIVFSGTLFDSQGRVSTTFFHDKVKPAPRDTAKI